MATVTVTTSQNLSTVVYAANDDLVINPGVTLTITATPANRIRSIAATGGGGKLLVQNTSTTNMLKLSFTPGGQGAITTGIASLRFENNAECEFAGNWITVYTGNGAANQTVFSNLTVGGALIDIPTFVEVETGSGTGVYEKWTVVPKRSTTTFHNSQYGYNSRNPSTGTVAITAGGVVTLTGGTFDQTAILNKRFRAAGHATDYLISAYTSTTSVTLSNPDGTTYTGGAIGAGATYVVRVGSALEQDDFGSGEHGTVLFLDPFGGNALGSAQTIVCGDGTNGKVIPNGAKVRVPNIYVGADLASTTLAAAITGTTAAAITLTSGANFPATMTQWTANNSIAGSLLVYDPATGKGERIGYTTISASVVSATGMTRGAFNSEAQTFPIGSTVYFIPHAALQNGLNFFDLQAGGKLTADKVMFGLNFSVSPLVSSVGLVGSKQLTFTNVGCTETLMFPNATGIQGDVLFDNFSFTQDFRNIGDTNINKPIVQSVGGTFTFKNFLILYSNDYSTNAGGSVALTIQNCLTVSEITNVKVLYVKTSYTGSSSGISINTIGPCTVSNIKSTGSNVLNYIDNCVFKDIYVSGGCSPSYVSLAGTGATNLQSNVTNCIFRGFQNLEAIPVGRSNNGLIISGLTTKNNIFTNKGYPTFNFRNSGGTNPSFFADTGRDNTFAYFDFINCRDNASPIDPNASNPGQRLVKITSDQYNATILTTATGLRQAYRGYRDIVFGPQVNSTSTVFNLDINPLTVMTDGTGSGSAGYLCFGPLWPEDQYTGTYSGLSATAYLNATGALAITTTGDQVTIGNQYSQKGISSFNTGGSITIIGNTSGTVTAGAFNGVNYEFRMCNWGDSLTALAWQSLTLTNLESARAALTGYSTSVGINMQIRATATTTVSARTVTLLRIPITWDTAYTPATGTFNFEVTNVLAGSTVALSQDGGTTWSQITTAAASTVTLPVNSDFLGNTISYKLRVRKAGYDPIEVSGTVKDDVVQIGEVGVSIRVDQVQTLDANGTPVYGNGTTSALVSLDYAALRVDIGNGSVSGADLYDTVVNNAVNTTGIKYAWPISSPGLAGGFDVTVENTWKLRRKLVTDTNAAISVFVLYGPNPALSPVDTVNGTVALSHTFVLAVTGSLTGSVLGLSLDGGSTWSTATSTGATVNFNVVFTTYGGTKNYIVRVRKAGYTPLQYSGSLTYQNGSIPAAQVQVVDINGVAVYGRGPGTTTGNINIVPASSRVDISNALVVGEDLYDYIAAWEATTTGVQYPEVLQFNGTDSIILNNFKLRRWNATDTNAMIDMIVFYGPNTTLNPVDEANGSVQLFPRVVRQGSLTTIGQAVWDYQTSSATTSGSMGERLKDASTVATNGQQLTAALT